MAKKKKKTSRRKQTKPTAQQAKDCGLALVAQKKFAQALPLLERASKQFSDHEAVKQGLLQTYQSLGDEAANAGDWVQAATYYDAGFRLQANAMALQRYLEVLLKTQQVGKVLAIYTAHIDQLSDVSAAFSALWGQCVPYLLVHPTVLETLPPDSPLARYDQRPIQLFKQAFSHPEKALTRLNVLPITSPYRDLRLLLTGLCHFQMDKSAIAQTVWQKIPVATPFQELIQVLLGCHADPLMQADRLSRYSPEALQLWSTLHRLSPAKQKVLMQLKKLQQTAPSPNVLFGVLLKHAKAFGPAGQVLAKQLLPQVSCAAQRQYEKVWGKLTPIEQQHLQAWQAEHQADYEEWEPLEEAIEQWQQLATLYQAKKETALAAAIYLHCAALSKKMREKPAVIHQHLDQALTVLPTHKAAHLQAMTLTLPLSTQEKKAVLRATKRACTALPDDHEILAAALAVYVELGSAAQTLKLCRQLLALSPIHQLAKCTLADTQLTKIRQTFLAKGRVLSLQSELKDIQIHGEPSQQQEAKLIAAWIGPEPLKGEATPISLCCQTLGNHYLALMQCVLQGVLLGLSVKKIKALLPQVATLATQPVELSDVAQHLFPLFKKYHAMLPLANSRVAPNVTYLINLLILHPMLVGHSSMLAFLRDIEAYQAMSRYLKSFPVPAKSETLAYSTWFYYKHLVAYHRKRIARKNSHAIARQLGQCYLHATEAEEILLAKGMKQLMRQLIIAHSGLPHGAPAGIVESICQSLIYEAKQEIM